MLWIELVVVVIFCFPILFLDRISQRFATHQKIDMANVRSARFIQTKSGERILTPSETAKLIALYNQLIFIQKREKPTYDHPNAALVIELATNEQIRLQLSDKDIDVQRIRQKNTVTFWGKQDALKEWLNIQGMEIPAYH